MSTNLNTNGDQVYRVDFNLHHPSCEPQEITKELCIAPWYVRRSGVVIAGIQHNSSAWLCHFGQGSGNTAFNQTLQHFLAFLQEHGTFLETLIEEGTAEIVLKSDVAWDDGKLYDVTLDPLLLHSISKLNIQLRLQVWSETQE